VILTQTFEMAVAVLDSALHVPMRPDWTPRRASIVSTSEITTLFASLPRRLRPLGSACNPNAEAGSESVARVRLMLAGILATPQVWVTDHIRVDLLIGDRLVIEIGSFRYHGNAAAYERDHERLATLLALGFVVLEFTYHQVMNDWNTVELIIRTAIAHGSHRHVPQFTRGELH
jgi:very-short-patch-repair endonuclease